MIAFFANLLAKFKSVYYTFQHLAKQFAKKGNHIH